MKKEPIPLPLLTLYDDYCHGRIDRRDFLGRAGALTIAGASAAVMAASLLPRYARRRPSPSPIPGSRAAT
jgi:carboxymethylenebutenolidase